jgi:hypothetical protein
MVMPHDDGEGFTNLTIRFPNALVERLDARVESLRSGSPGARFTRSDVIRMGAEQLLARELEPARKPQAKKVAGRR